MVFYTNRFIPERFAGCTHGPFIFIRPEYKDDKGLHAHERTHRFQWLMTLGVHSLLYALWPTYRLHAEVMAYVEQAHCYPDDRTALFGAFIAEKYGLSISAEDATRLLRDEMRPSDFGDFR